MTVSSTTSRSGPYFGNGITTVFDYDFRILDGTHLTVVRTVAGEDTIVSPSDYAVTGVGNADGGSIAFTLPPSVGAKITIIRNAPFTQGTDLENQGEYYAETIERALDLAAMRDQQLEERLDRTVSIPVGADPTTLSMLVGNILRLADSADNIDVVADNIGAVDGLAPHAGTIASNLEDIHNFASVYQGAKSSDPVARNDGSALEAGDLYFNTTSERMRVYSGAGWEDPAAPALNLVPNNFTGNGAQTKFLLSTDPAIAANVLVWVNGVRKSPLTDYSVSGPELTFAVPPNGSIETLVIATPSTLEVPAYGTIVWPVSSRTQLKALSPAAIAAHLNELGREGTFVWRAGDYSSQVALDTQEGIYIQSNSIPTTSGAWVRQFSGPLDVRWFGAVGDGVTDCSVAFQAAIDVAKVADGSSLIGGTVLIPSGTKGFVVDGTGLVIGNGSMASIRTVITGEGPSSIIWHKTPNALFRFSGTVGDFTAKDFEVRPLRSSDDQTKGVFYAPQGITNSRFSGIKSLGNGTHLESQFFFCPAGQLMDNVIFEHIFSSHRKGGLKIGKGSSVYIVGGRYIGQYPTVAGSIGLHLSGGMGGVWCWGTDFINNANNIQLNAESGESNRELFLTHACVDGGYRGLLILDESYTSWTGVWASAADQACIECTFSSNSGLLNLSGGTIFNAGVNGREGSAQGLIFGIAGRVDMSGVSVRNNVNAGVVFTSDSPAVKSNIRACSFYANGTGGASPCHVQLAGQVRFEGNSFNGGSTNYVRRIGSSTGLRIRDNEGAANDFSTPAMGASGANVTNSYGRFFNVYIRNGTVSSVKRNGAEVFNGGNCVVLLEPGDTINVTYSAAPNWVWQPL